MTISVALYRKMESLEPSLRDILLTMADEISDTPTKEDFTDLRVSLQELAEAQKRTEIKLEQLAEAQRKTEHELRFLGKTVKKIEVAFGGLAVSLGYQLEDSVYPLLPKILKEDFGIEVEGDLERKFIIYPDGRDDEVNIYGKGASNGREIYLIGEAKAQVGKADVRRFAAMLKRLEGHLRSSLQPFMICYSIHPMIEEYIASEYPTIKVYQTFQIQRRNRN